MSAYVAVWLILLCLCYQSYWKFDAYGLYEKGDWVKAGVITALYVLFLIEARKLLGKYAISNQNYLAYQAVWWHLVMQTLFGTLHALGMLDLPVSLPFTGLVGIYTDTIGFALLLACGWEEKDNQVVPILTLVQKKNRITEVKNPLQENTNDDEK